MSGASAPLHHTLKIVLNGSPKEVAAPFAVAELIATLDETKNKAVEIGNSLEQAKFTSAEIQKSREQYIPAALRVLSAEGPVLREGAQPGGSPDGARRE